MRRRGGGGGRRRQFRRPGCGVPGADSQARAHARARPTDWRNDVALPDSAHRRQPAIHLRTDTRSWRSRATAISSACAGDNSATATRRNARHQARVRDDRCLALHRVAGRLRGARRKGFIKTGPDLSPEDLAAGAWPLARPPYLLETSLPGVFAVGDVRGGNIKRVASAVGEGSIAVAFVHRVLHE